MSNQPEEAVVRLYRKRQRIHPREISGRFQSWRWVFVFLTQAVFYGLPWLEWNARQAVLFDLEARRFFLFGLVLYPQDLFYLTALLLLSAYSLFLFTAVAGRLWCGYACPQTVYTSIFLWVEQRFEGSKAQRERFDHAPWSGEKLRRRGGKHLVWVALALVTGFTFVGYFTPIKTLWVETLQGQLGPWQSFWILFYAFATWGNAGFMREQVCKYMCPYARFQSAMFDRDTLIIGYDVERGEPRGARGRKDDLKAKQLGHCIDCGLCVQVCPVGIDIRKGLQYECIGCAACVDACDQVMAKMQYPLGLIRYDTENGIEQHLSRGQEWLRVLRPRVWVYAAGLVLITGVVGYSLWARPPMRYDVVRDRGALARFNEQGQLENVYRIQLMNVVERPQRYRIRVQTASTELPALELGAVGEVELGAVEARWLPVTVQLPANSVPPAPGAYAIEFTVERLAHAQDDTRVVPEKSTFVVPR
ncbi:cytochrome c oxidase accessory protein CcoG [Inhella gelatinilytica]|uniref:Cytochrome c oxidase accessory protein CcoG n=1 Tax=Inhella gelatinilytica TaxID=2795030 RepID=A0A931NEF1_9BURK|nr:cytochrome c oxidase accessory protein CcoG [Inhella gelatinilytica]MBH9554102.1 cytochrome c oxidase accessory protein CcoG [Inhella gelatinilytica]